LIGVGSIGVKEVCQGIVKNDGFQGNDGEFDKISELSANARLTFAVFPMNQTV
jgi:hypothetical protein